MLFFCCFCYVVLPHCETNCESLPHFALKPKVVLCCSVITSTFIFVIGRFVLSNILKVVKGCLRLFQLGHQVDHLIWLKVLSVPYVIIRHHANARKLQYIIMIIF